METFKPSIREIVVKQIELDDLDNVVDIQFFGQHPDGENWDYDWVHDYDSYKYFFKNNEHVPIDMLLEAIIELKEAGATHVQIYPHGDHWSYYLTGVKLEVMAVDDVKEKRRKELERAITNGKVSLRHEEEELEERKKRLERQKEELVKLNKKD